MFKITVATTPARSLDNDLDRNIAYFLSDIGYIPRVSPTTDLQTIRDSAYFRLFRDCFLLNSDRYWTGDELMAYLRTSRTTLYRHLNKLKSMDILEEVQEGKTKKYRLRSGDLMKAWNWVEVNTKLALDNYRKTVEQISRLTRNIQK
ncbi:MAG: helix-turn-helix domain-containing protein [Candidatus Thermoplasmatota archaeon]|jgi:DNA-binding transcriptional ArsR family regulator|nr:helix-turn-helix domain-containing protein [Candidatus Thermoplasmatota archaeon]